MRLEQHGPHSCRARAAHCFQRNPGSQPCFVLQRLATVTRNAITLSPKAPHSLLRHRAQKRSEVYGIVGHSPIFTGATAVHSFHTTCPQYLAQVHYTSTSMTGLQVQGRHKPAVPGARRKRSGTHGAALVAAVEHGAFAITDKAAVQAVDGAALSIHVHDCLLAVRGRAALTVGGEHGAGAAVALLVGPAFGAGGLVELTRGSAAAGFVAVARACAPSLL